jgi:hypothetical protein
MKERPLNIIQIYVYLWMASIILSACDIIFVRTFLLYIAYRIAFYSFCFILGYLFKGLSFSKIAFVSFSYWAINYTCSIVLMIINGRAWERWSAFRRIISNIFLFPGNLVGWQTGGPDADALITQPLLLMSMIVPTLIFLYFGNRCARREQRI